MNTKEMPCINKARPAGFEQKPRCGLCCPANSLGSEKGVMHTHRNETLAP